MLPNALSSQEVRKVAALARLRVEEHRIDALSAELAAILRHVDLLRTLDLSGVEPMTRVADAELRELGPQQTGPSCNPRDDCPNTPMAAGEAAALSPDPLGPFVRVPRVLGDGGGA